MTTTAKHILSANSEPLASTSNQIKREPFYQPLELMDCFLTGFDRVHRSFNHLKLSEERIEATLKELSEKKLQVYDRKQYSGFVYRKEINLGGYIFARGDLHGDLATLVCNLEALKNDGFLDNNYLPKEGNTFIIIGDMVDRGDHSLEVLTLLASMQKGASDRVVLLRGDHENVEMNDTMISQQRLKGKYDESFYRFLLTQQNRETLAKYYETLPDALYLTAKGNKPNYLLFAHGLPPYHFDPSLHFGAPQVQLVPKKIEISKEMDTRGENGSFSFSFYEALRRRDHCNVEDRSMFLWGRLSVIETSLVRRSSGKCTMLPETVVRILDLYKEKVSVLIRAHDHVPSRISVEAKPDMLRIFTLSVAMAGEAFRSVRESKKGQILSDNGILLPVSDHWDVDIKFYRTEVVEPMKTTAIMTYPFLKMLNPQPTTGPRTAAS
jgi:hypothetical protein